MCIILGVNWFKATMMFALVGVFALATNHCRLEVLQGLEFLICCSHDAGELPHQDDDCETDGCAILEEGLYKSEDGRIINVAETVQIEEMYLAPTEPIPPSSVLENFSTSAIPELPVSWQFIFRVASSPRAPSIAS